MKTKQGAVYFVKGERHCYSNILVLCKFVSLRDEVLHRIGGNNANVCVYTDSVREYHVQL